MNHLHVLELALSNERQRLAFAKGAARELRAVWCAQLEREIAAERAFLGKASSAPLELTADELLAELLG